MYAVKQAQITREHLPGVKDIDIYYMDMRSYGKDFERYVENGKKKYGIRLIRSRVGSVARREDGRLLLKSCAPDGTQAEEAYDLVVLSAGFKAQEENVGFFRRTGIRTDRYGFITCDPFAAPATSVEGIFACGAAAGPKDIPETCDWKPAPPPRQPPYLRTGRRLTRPITRNIRRGNGRSAPGRIPGAESGWACLSVASASTSGAM
jgi:heterodisulfide reductase subunit A-like polyferredoxin